MRDNSFGKIQKGVLTIRTPKSWATKQQLENFERDGSIVFIDYPGNCVTITTDPR